MSRKISRGIRKFVPRMARGLPIGATLVCADNSGAKELKLITVFGYKGRLRKLGKAGIGDRVNVSVTKGKQELRKQVLQAVIVRQRKPFRRPDGTWMQFEDNAAVLIKPGGEPQGSELRGPMAREVTLKWPRVAAIASKIV
ncbi:MAG: 50S ribosomal protein L14 [Candidatus Thorarchaeota archaeon]|nr:MAG: 50S ribosomal protein L14 [Candidatus Thorarchaeota archaeon]RLI61467.1 MAG: 50S ribosomal protein L14 [Candidatus Thorarchaeota archaeon]